MIKLQNNESLRSFVEPFQTTVHFVTYNVGNMTDTLGKLERAGEAGIITNKKIIREYEKFKPLHQDAMNRYNKELAMLTEEEKKNIPWYKHPSFAPGQEIINIINGLRSNRMNKMFNLIKKKCDIILLQEVNTDLEPIKKILGNKFSLLWLQCSNDNTTPPDTVVGWDNNKFRQLEIKDENEVKLLNRLKLKVTAVRLQNLVTNHVIDVVSIHASGYSILDPKPKVNVTKSYNGVELGNKIVERAIKILEINKDSPLEINKDSPPSVAIVAGDFNSERNPTYYTCKEDLSLSQERFELLINNNFNMISHNRMTCYNPEIAKRNKGNGSCSLDHIFMKNLGSSRGTIQLLSEAKFQFKVGDINRQPSDHEPIFFDLKL